MTWKTISTKTLHSDEWQEACLDTVETQSGHQTNYFYLNKKEDGAVLIALDAEKRIGLLSIYRHPVGEVILQVPVEGVKLGEEEMDAAMRGVKEELEMYARTVEKIGEYYVDPGTLKQKAKVFLAYNLEVLKHKVDHGPVEADTIHTVHWLTLEEIEEKIKLRQIKDSWTISAIYSYKMWLENGSRD